MTWMQDGESPTFDNADYMAAMEQVFPSAFTDALREQVPRLTFVLDERGRRASRNGTEGVFRHCARRLSAVRGRSDEYRWKKDSSDNQPLAKPG